MQLDTIAALSTPIAAAGLGVIRVSGEQALQVAGKVFRGKDLTQMEGYTAAFGHVFDSDGDIDECVALVFRAPHSYTGEDTVELSCHGGVYLLKRVLRALYAAGARPAEAGEFTRRAFVNGKMDLTGAEAVMDLIAADGALAARTALAARSGAVFRHLTAVKDSLLGLSAQFSAFVDYPDDDIPDLGETQLQTTLQGCVDSLERLLRDFDAGRILREGVDTVIAGSPNVGKSTLMNMLSGFDRSIVTPVAGTTRDIVEETVKVGDITLRLADTAGIRDTGDTVEAIGVQRARARLADAGLVLAVFDGSKVLNDADRTLIAQLENTPAIAIINKSDLPQQMDTAYLQNKFRFMVELSAKDGTGKEALTEAVAQITGVYRLQADTPLLATERQRAEAVRAVEALKEGLAALESGLTADAVSVCVDSAVSAILSLTGERTTDAVVNEVFSRFCVGK